MASQDAIVLNNLSGDPDNSAGDAPGSSSVPYEFSLPQADGGKDAWLFLAAGFVIEALVWGQLFMLFFE